MSEYWWFVIIYVIGLIVAPFIIYYNLCVEYKDKKDNGTLERWEEKFDDYLEQNGEFSRPTIVWPLIFIFSIIAYIDSGIYFILKQIRKKTGIE